MVTPGGSRRGKLISSYSRVLAHFALVAQILLSIQIQFSGALLVFHRNEQKMATDSDVRGPALK